MSFRIENKYRMSLSDQKIFKASLLSRGLKSFIPQEKLTVVILTLSILIVFMSLKMASYQERKYELDGMENLINIKRKSRYLQLKVDLK